MKLLLNQNPLVRSLLMIKVIDNLLLVLIRRQNDREFLVRER